MWAVSALGAPRLRRGHELLWAGEDELDPEQRNGIPLSNALPCRASCANAWRKPNGGLRVPASPCCARDGLVVLPPRRSTRVLRPVPPLVPDRQVRPLRTPARKKVSSGTPATTSALRPARSTLSVPRRASRWPCPAPRKTAPQVLGSAASAPFVVNNARLLPWVRIKHIPCPRTGDVCSTTGTAVTLCVRHCLRPFAKASRELAAVQPTRVGKTQGRGKLDVKNEYALPVKDARPLRRDEGSQSQTITRVANAHAAWETLALFVTFWNTYSVLCTEFFYSGTENCEFSTPRTRFLQIPPQGPPPGHHALRQTTAPGKKT